METGWEKMKRRMSEEPLVPIGCLATRFMRARIAAQGATVVALAFGSVLAMKKN
ncbi:TPA: hypothetical protein N0F65_009276 [Lagenidium giganteum]|uniref:HIG1 domain-containing protein n=1 Tax=Lagenidium giganteum TaxID=4803 RepID=A0AAV2YLV6_9STRA|nr:TPA: hypothetical protein N0F65_009276 [Lagenidium giganteum]